MTLILFEEFVTYRQVFTDGRPLPVDAQPAWWGYSVGRWNGMHLSWKLRLSRTWRGSISMDIPRLMPFGLLNGFGGWLSGRWKCNSHLTIPKLTRARGQ